MTLVISSVKQNLLDYTYILLLLQQFIRISTDTLNILYCLYYFVYIDLVFWNWHTRIPWPWTQVLDAGLLDAVLWTLGSESWTLDAGPWTLDPGCWTLDAGSWMLDSECWALNAGYWTLDTRRWTLNARLWMLNTRLRASKLWNLKLSKGV